ncbi:MAG: hypothetical protein RL456_522, partial [Pseudomonadota bacterium]
AVMDCAMRSAAEGRTLACIGA